MSLRHAAVLLLVGWYFIAPPLLNNDPENLILNAPMRNWQVIGSFDTAGQCENMRLVVLDAMPKDERPALKQAREQRMRMAFCIASDDPRLKQ